MDLTPNIISVAPIIIGLIIAFFIIKKRTRPKVFINRYRDGNPVRLNGSISIDVKLSKEEYVLVNNQLSLKANWFTRWWIYILVFAILVNLASIKIWATDHIDFLFLLKEYGPPLVIITGVIFVSRFFIKKQSSNVFDATELLKSSCNYTFNDEGYKILSNNVTHSANWQTIHGYMLLPGHVLVFSAPLQCMILPQAAFSAEELTKFTSFLSSNFELRQRLT